MPQKGRKESPAAKRGARLAIKKTWKLYIGGAFLRSESGRYLVTPDHGDDGSRDNFARASRKDARDAVKAALDALARWSKVSAYQRGQILYRLAEVMESRRAELEHSLKRAGAREAGRETGAAIDRVVSYAGWSDKFQSMLASSNPVASPHFAFSVPEPVGVVAIAAPSRPSLLGLVGCLAPVIVSGNVTVAVASELDPRTALLFAECLHTSDFPGGVVNLLTGSRAELLPVLARHKAVRALDLWDIDAAQAAELERDAAENCKRVSRRAPGPARFYDERWATSPALIARFVEIKSVWHPMGV